MTVDVGKLLARQFPQWANLPVKPVEPAGTDNAIFRLGTDMCVRLPQAAFATGHIAKEGQWLPKFAPVLPLAIPVPLAQGEPAEGYPWPWAVYQWLDGENASLDSIADPRAAAQDLGNFVATLQRIDPTDGPLWGEHNGFRGQPLAMRDEETREAIKALRDSAATRAANAAVEPGGAQGSISAGPAATAAWEAALQTPVWDGPGVWLHGDLHPGNLLAHRGRLSAVIDFGLLAVGDPACDLMVAWTFLDADTRDVFRAAVSVDDETWARGRGWALSFALIALAGYEGTASPLVPISQHAISEVLAELDPARKSSHAAH